MAHLSLCLVLLLMAAAAVAVAEAVSDDQRPKKVKCHHKKLFPDCYEKELYCPSTCPRDCEVDCQSCQPVCTAAPAPSPKSLAGHKPKKVKCHDKKNYPLCHQKDLFCPTTCPRDCEVDCQSCQPVCTATPASSPTPSTVKPKKVKCHDKKNFPDCHQKELYCPTACPRTCVVDCLSCQPICSATPTPTPATHTPASAPATHPPAPAPVPSNSTPVPWSPPSSGPKQVSCKNKNYPHCYRMVHRCPSDCPDQCEVDCVTCSPVCHCNRPGAVCEDPRFIGNDGITFYFHGKKDGDFCLVTDSNLHINAHFIGRRNAGMKRDFTWVQSLGILFDSHKLFIGAQRTAAWDDAIDRLSLSFDGQTVLLPEEEEAKWSFLDRVTIKRTRNTNSVEIEVKDNFKIKATVVPITEKDSRIHNYGITQEDCFAHLDLNFKFYSLSGEVNGVLGQTYAKNYVSRVKMGVAMPVLGGEKEFASSGLFATDCSVARFTAEIRNGENYEFANLSCASGMDGRGVVCKR